MNKTFIPAALTVLWFSCSGVPSTPETVYQAFYQTVADGDWGEAAGFLCPEALDAFRRVGMRLATMSRSNEDPLSLFLGGLVAELVSPLQRVEVASRQEGAVVLRVSAGSCGTDEQCAVSQVTLRRHQGRWVVCPELPELLTRPAAGEASGNGRKIPPPEVR